MVATRTAAQPRPPADVADGSRGHYRNSDRPLFVTHPHYLKTMLKLQEIQLLI
jgi:hypothetical protein